LEEKENQNCIAHNKISSYVTQNDSLIEELNRVMEENKSLKKELRASNSKPVTASSGSALAQHNPRIPLLNLNKLN